jgi:hypothetical protein
MGKFLSSFAQSEGNGRVGNSPFRFPVHAALCRGCWEWYLCIGDFLQLLVQFGEIIGVAFLDGFKGVSLEFRYKLGLRIELASGSRVLRWLNVGIALSGVFVARVGAVSG